MIYDFSTGLELCARCAEYKLPICEIMRNREIVRSEQNADAINAQMLLNLETMRDSIKKGLEEDHRSVSGLTGGDAARLYAASGTAIMGEKLANIVAYSMAVVEVNSCMGRIVAAPTAGASGILPAVLIGCGEQKNWSDEMLINGLFTAGAVGALIAMNATISGADGGCQAETGAAAAMAAAAVVELSGGTPEQALDAAAIALKNVMGLVCDPVAGLVECPCIKRNAIGAANAAVSADLALAGIKSIIPFDEAVSAMKSVGRLMNPDLRETAKGGLAATPTARELERTLGLKNEV